MRFYNTLGRNMQDFQPIEEKVAKMYTCGPTVYNYAHIGNFRAYLFEDLLRRSLEYHGYKVTQVMNLTDVDDKTIRDSRAAGLKLQDFTRKYKDAFFEDLRTLRIEPAEHYPEATTHIPEMIEMIRILFEKGFAYKSEDGSVYFSIAKFKDYGKLAKIDMEQQRSGVRINNDEYDKDSVADFALWKAWSESDGDVKWDSPWGPGRPGWHLECSAMSMKYLGESFDFHGGGSDLIFPHHENEIAQSEGCTGVHPFVRYWLHNGFITVNEEKMSKSLGNFFTVADILEHFEPETLRFFILSTHYRSPLDFSDERLKEAQRSLARLKTAQDNLKELAQLISGGPTETSKALYAKLEELRTGFMEAMSDDFNTALAISFMFELAKEVNIYHQHIGASGEKPDGKLVENMEKLFAEFCGIIGVLETSAQPAAEKDASLEDKLIETVVSLRQEARAAKNYAQADALRNALTGLGIVLEDTPQGVRWKKQ